MKIVVRKISVNSDIQELRLTLSHLSFLEKLSNQDEKETCALIFGLKKDNTCEVKEIVPMNEVSERSVVHFSMDPVAAFNEIEKAEKKGLQLIAIYHSHPGTGNPHPSGTDRTFMKYWPVVWLISNKGKGSEFVLKGYQLTEKEGSLKDISLMITSENGDRESDDSER